MVALPESTIQPTVAAINAHYERHQDAKPAQRLTARLLGLNCERQGWYALRWAHEPKPLPGSIIRANIGRRDAMNELAQCLVDVGATVTRVDPKTYEQLEVVAAGGHYKQQVAGIVTGLLEAPATAHFLYTDQQPAKVVAQIQKHGLTVAKPDRIAPIQMGMHVMGLTLAFYLVRNKDSDELFAERIQYDAGHALALMAKAERIRDAHEPPARISEDPGWFECRYCPAFDACHCSALAPRNCRTCIHAAPIADGDWRCIRFDRVLSVMDQKSGCPHHLYLPGLVAGEQVDTDGENTVTYRRPDGATWVDGRAVQ